MLLLMSLCSVVQGILYLLHAWCRSVKDVEDVKWEVDVMREMNGCPDAPALKGVYEDEQHVHLVCQAYADPLSDIAVFNDVNQFMYLIMAGSELSNGALLPTCCCYLCRQQLIRSPAHSFMINSQKSLLAPESVRIAQLLGQMHDITGVAGHRTLWRGRGI